MKATIILLILSLFSFSAKCDDEPNAMAIIEKMTKWKSWKSGEAFEGEGDVSLDPDVAARFSINPFRKLKKKISIQRNAQCEGNECTACLKIMYKQKEFNFCAALSYTKEKSGLKVSLIIQSNKIVSKRFKDRDFCLSYPLPFGSLLGEACLGYFGTELEDGNFSTCVEANVKMLKKKLIRADFGCFGYVNEKFKFFEPVPEAKKPKALLFSLNVPQIFKTAKEATQNKLKKLNWG